jgi:acetylglutamate kinase
MTGSAADSPEVLVVKLGGTTIAEERDVLAEIAALAPTRRIVVVHGGGKRLTEWLGRLGVESRFEDGLRVTDDAALEVALAVLGGLVNGELVAALRGLEADAVGIRGLDGGTIHGSRATSLGRVVDRPVAEPGLLSSLLAAGRLPVVAPIGLDDDGIVCNVNADDAAAALAAALGGELLLLTDTDGVRGADGQRIPTLDVAEAERLIADGVISGGMVPKVRSALHALRPGSVIGQAIVADGRGQGALMQALEGGGTRFRRG